MDDGDVIQIEKGRHPVIEQTIRDGIFVSNDTYLNKEDQSLLLITGPNMSGKSTYMRQTALIVLMAQAGCFVPCERARIGVCDRIFTRIGASDNLAQGQSTFFVEMSELSYILNTATSRSLVILDEIGRGTSTYDGLSIAWAAAEYLCGSGRKIRTLFATHYHEMTALEGTLPGAKNLNVDVAEENGNVVFLHKIVEGSASRSYGIHVAKLAGAPKELLERAQERLADLENGSTVRCCGAASPMRRRRFAGAKNRGARRSFCKERDAGQRRSRHEIFCKEYRFGSVRAAFLFRSGPVGYHAEAARSGSDEHYAVAGFADFRRTERVFIRVYYDSCIRETHCG